MKILVTSLLALAALVSLSQGQVTTPAPKSPGPAVILPPQAPDVPAIKLGPDGQPKAGFLPAHERFVKIAQEGKAQLVFLGDSITAGWAAKKDIWDKAFGAWEPANFGIGGDRTQHVLWRIQNGELETIKPKAIVLMIGTNNVGADSAEGIAKGITAIVKTIREKQPQAKLLLLGVFPRGEKASPNPSRDKLKEVNQIIAKLDNGDSIHYLDIGDKFLQPDGSLTKEIMPDFLHLSPAGYQIWADAITPKLGELMK
ncbi:Lysophospholipase L1 [Prosthecobacter debontii]|uniref:Lysophospholipase L1 n=1 Tax=Prosthecobacter debontii TaxID=48467 RepID=A0A1T4YB20_9BACT|nr:platelet-activating factor acetylhydrolase IB subunit [Prosthecobacter debontii]SKA98718.1 Lysophospholipase L1 [Prosthecobacter debontii]